MTNKTIAFLLSGNVEITQVMIDAGSKTADLIHSADCISCLDGGLGGGMKKADAPADIAQYFDRPEGSSVPLMFKAMDALAPSPFGEPTEAMIEVGSHMMSRLVDAAFIKAALKFDPSEDDIDPDLIVLAKDERSVVAIMYNAMIMSTYPTPAPDEPVVRIYREEARAMNVASLVVTGVPAAQALSAKLVAESAFFTCTPLPDDQYEFTVKADRAAVLEASYTYS